MGNELNTTLILISSSIILFSITSLIWIKEFKRLKKIKDDYESQIVSDGKIKSLHQASIRSTLKRISAFISAEINQTDLDANKKLAVKSIAATLSTYPISAGKLRAISIFSQEINILKNIESEREIIAKDFGRFYAQEWEQAMLLTLVSMKLELLEIVFTEKDVEPVLKVISHTQLKNEVLKKGF